MPPICVASSVNNQAVTNIIESFQSGELDDAEIAAFALPKKASYQKMSTQKSTLVAHWLPGHNTYGLYLASNRKLKNGPLSYAAISPQDKTYLDQMTTADALKEAMKYFCKTIVPCFRVQLVRFKNAKKPFIVI